MEEAVHRLLAAEIGLETESVGASSVRAAVAARMKSLRLTDLHVYEKRLASREEVAALIDEVVIPETWFFRDRTPFEMVAALAAAAAPGKERMRVLSAPCSSGEEPYSIAMLLLDAGIALDRFRIDAIDVSAPLLARAQAATYGPFSFRGGDFGARDRHFRRLAGPEERWELSGEVRGAVSFARDNLLSPLRLAAEPPYDLIFCRNLLIYLTADARRRVLDTLAAALAPDGRIVVGHAEALDTLDPRFVAAEPKGAFSYALRNRAAPEAPAVSRTDVVRAPPVSAPPVSAPAPPRAVRARKGSTPPARSRRPALEVAAELADRGELAAAAALCEERLREVGDDAAAHQLLGVVRQAQGDAAAAELCFARALYLEPERAASMLHLALLLDRRGDAAGASRLRRRAARQKELV